MIEPFKGELFIHPAALDYSGNLCSNACAYCFASMRSADRRASLVKLSKLCLGKCASETLTDWLFNQGHAVCVSNRSDPFAASNIDNTKVALELLNLVPNGVFFQTKGISPGVDPSVLDGFKKKNAVVYITIDTLSDDICRRVEPGAPLPGARLDLARYAKSRGWEVIIGLNPCVREWLPPGDLDRLVDTLLQCGVDRYLIMPLSLNSKDVAAMNPARRERLSDAAVRDAVGHSGDYFYWRDQYRRLNRAGLRAYSIQGPLPCHMDDAACAALGKHMNSVQHFVDFAWDTRRETGRVLFSFSDFLGVMTKGNPEMLDYRNADCYKYIMCVNRSVWKAGGLAKSARSFVDVYRVLWNERRLTHSPQNVWCFTVLADGNGRPVRDDLGDIQLVFLGGGPIPSRERKATMTAEELMGKGVNLP